MLGAIKPQDLIKGLSHLFFPNLCEGCRRPLVDAEEVICLSCETYLSLTNYHHIPSNDTAVRLFGRIPFQHVTSLAWFTDEGLVQHLVHALKYKGRTQIGTYLGKKLGNAINEAGWKIDAVVPVPLYKAKKFSRGYNQSAVVAEGISEVLKVPVLEKVVARIRNTETQTDKSREERIENVANAFALLHPEQLVGKHVLLIDDVLTTGATVESCTRELLKAGDVHISIATIGIATS